MAGHPVGLTPGSGDFGWLAVCLFGSIFFFPLRLSLESTVCPLLRPAEDFPRVFDILDIRVLGGGCGER